MTMGRGPQKEKVLDGNEINLLWHSLGTLNKVSDELVKRGIRNPRTGKPVSKAAITMSNWRWCIHNPQESFERAKKFRTAAGEKLSKEDWDAELIRHARKALTPNGYVKFLEKNGLEQLARSVR